MLIEILLCLLHLLLTDEAHVTEAAVGKAVNDRAANEVGQIVVYHCSDVCTDCCKQNH